LLSFLKDVYIVKFQSAFDWCRNKRNLPFDFEIVDKHILIELDGIQHLETNRLMGDSDVIMNNDVYKMKAALIHGYTIIRILQEDIYEDKYDWKSELVDAINTSYETPTCIFLCKNNEYIKHQTLLISDNELTYQVSNTRSKKSLPVSQ
jgi:hypothetical protein